MAAGEQGSERRCRSAKGRSYEDPHTVPAVGIEANVRPIGEDGGSKVTKAKAGKYDPSKIHTPFQQSVSKLM